MLLRPGPALSEPAFTATAAASVSDNQNSITAGPRGPVLMQDFFLSEKPAHQNRERIPERGQNAKGSGAYGTLAITHDIAKSTGAKPVGQEPRKANGLHVAASVTLLSHRNASPFWIISWLTTTHPDYGMVAQFLVHPAMPTCS